MRKKKLTIQFSDIDGHTLYRASIDALKRDNAILMRDDITREHPFSAKISTTYPSIFGLRVNMVIDIMEDNTHTSLSIMGLGDVVDAYGRRRPDIFHFHTVRSINRMYKNLTEVLKKKYNYPIRYRPFSIMSYISFYLFIISICIIFLSFTWFRFFIKNGGVLELCVYLLLFIVISIIYNIKKQYESRRRLRFLIFTVGFLVLIVVRYFVPYEFCYSVGIKCGQISLAFFALLTLYLLMESIWIIGILQSKGRTVEYEIKDMRDMEIEKITSKFLIFAKVFGFISLLLGILLGIFRGFTPISILIILIGLFLIFISLHKIKTKETF